MMRISLPIFFWTVLVNKINYSDPFHPLKNLQIVKIRTGTDHHNHFYNNHESEVNTHVGKLQEFEPLRMVRNESQDDSNRNSGNSEGRLIRAEYLQWCERYNKQANENRYPQFVSNYKVMSSIAKSGGKPMHLNEFADFTGEEYKKLMEEKSKGDTQPSGNLIEKPAAKIFPAKAQIQRNEAIGRDESLPITKTLVEPKLVSSEIQQPERSVSIGSQVQSQKDQVPMSPTTKITSVENIPEKKQPQNSNLFTVKSEDINSNFTMNNYGVMATIGDRNSEKSDTENMDVVVSEEEAPESSTEIKQSQNLPSVKTSSDATKVIKTYDVMTNKGDKDSRTPENEININTENMDMADSGNNETNRVKKEQERPKQYKQIMKVKPEPAGITSSTHQENIVNITSRDDTSALTQNSTSMGKNAKKSESASKRKTISSFELMKEKYHKKADGVLGRTKLNDKDKAKVEERYKTENIKTMTKYNSVKDSKDRVVVAKDYGEGKKEIESDSKKVAIQAEVDFQARSKAIQEIKRTETGVQDKAEQRKQIVKEVRAEVAEEQQRRIEIEQKTKHVEVERQQLLEKEAEAERNRIQEDVRSKIELERRRRIEAEKRAQVTLEEHRLQIQRQAEERALIQSELSAQVKKERKLRIDAEEKVKVEVEERRRAIEIEEKVKAEEERKRIQAEARAKFEEERRRQIETEKIDKLEHEQRIRAEVKAEAEKERKRFQIEARAMIEEERNRRIEAERKTKHEKEERMKAEEKARAEEKSRRRIEVQKKADDKKQKQLQIDAETKAEIEQKANEILMMEKVRRKLLSVRLKKQKDAHRLLVEERATADKVRIEAEALKEAEIKTMIRIKEERKRVEAEAKKKFEEEKRRVEEAANKKIEDIRRRAEEAAQKKVEVEALKRAEIKTMIKIKEEKERMEAETKKKIEEERRRVEEAANAKIEDVKRRAKEAAQKIVEAEASKKAEIKTMIRIKEERKRVEAEAKKRIKEERKRVEEEADKKIEGVRRRAEENAQRKIEAEASKIVEAETRIKIGQKRTRAEAEVKKNTAEERRRVEEAANKKVKDEEGRIEDAEAIKGAEAERNIKIEEDEKSRVEEAEKLDVERMRVEKVSKKRIEEERKLPEKAARKGIDKAILQNIATLEPIINDADKEQKLKQILSPEKIRRKLLAIRLKEQKAAYESEAKFVIEMERSCVEAEAEARKKIDKEKRRLEEANKDNERAIDVLPESEVNDEIQIKVTENGDVDENKLYRKEDSGEKSKVEEEKAFAEKEREEKNEEMRIHGAYLDWCLEFSKKPDKIRMNQFKNNYILLEGVAKEEGTPIKLNEYADFTAAEYEKEVQAKEESKEREKQERARKEQEEVEAAFAAAGVDVDADSETTKGSSQNKMKVKDELFRIQDEMGNDVDEEKDEDNIVQNTDDEWWKNEKGLDESMLQTDNVRNFSSQGKKEGDENLSAFTSESSLNDENSFKAKKQDVLTNADDPETRRRVRAAYSNWCRTYNKEPDEGRFPKFKSNYVIMEKLAREQGREVKLNEFADCTPDEYAKASHVNPKSQNGAYIQQPPKTSNTFKKPKTFKVDSNSDLRRIKNIDINKRTVVSDKYDEAAANAEVERIALAKAEEAAKRIKEIRKSKKKLDKAKTEIGGSVEMDQYEVKQIERRRVPNKRANAKKAEEVQLKGKWQELSESKKAIAEQEQLRSQQLYETDEESQPVVKPPSSKSKSVFQSRPTFTTSLKESIPSNSDGEEKFGDYRSSWENRDGEESVDDDKNDDIKYASPNDDDYKESLSKIEVFSGESYHENVFNQASSSNVHGTVQNNDGGSYFMDVPPTDDEESSGKTFSLNQGLSGISSVQSKKLPDQPRTRVDDTSSEYSVDAGAWYKKNNSQSKNETPLKGARQDSLVDSSSRQGSLLNKGANYLENLSKGNTSPADNVIMKGTSPISTSNNPGKYSQQLSSPESAFPERIQAAYRDWCRYYGKAYSEDRLRTFSSNFLAVEKYHRETGVSLILNELADLTSDEFQKGKV